MALRSTKLSLPFKEKAPVGLPPTEAFKGDAGVSKPRDSLLRQSAKEKKPRSAVIRARQLLSKRFPLCFSKFKKPKQPLKIGITADIIAACPDVLHRDIRDALSDYTKGPTYQSALVEGAARIDLNGEPAGFVTIHDELYAKDRLARLPRSARSAVRS
jgi:ProP effector